MLVVIASALYTTLDTSTSLAQIIGYQVIAGVGFGCILNISMSTWPAELTKVVVLVQADYLSQQHLVPHVTNVFNVRCLMAKLTSVLGICRKDRRDVDRHQYL